MTKNPLTNILSLHRMPWVVRVYLLMFFALLGTLLYAAKYQPITGAADDNAHKVIIGLSADLLKLVVGALIGSLSLAAEKIWGGRLSSNENE